MIGIDISDRSIKIAEVVGGDSPTLRTLCWSPLPPNLMRRGVVQDVSAVVDALKRGMTSCKPVEIAGGDVVASIPEIQSFVRVLDLPPMAEQEIEEAVQWAVRRHIPFDLERVYLDWEPLASPHPQRRQVLVGAAQRDVADPLLAVLDELGLNVVALELEAQAVLRCLLPLDPKEAFDIQGVLAVDLGATATNIVFFDRGAMRYTASIQLGGDDLTQRLAHVLNLTPIQAVERKATLSAKGDGKDVGASVALREGTVELVRRVDQVVREMTVQLPPEEKIRVILLSGGGANLTGIIDLFAEVYPGIPVQLGNPWTNLQGDESKSSINVSTADAMHFTTALGLGLRREGYGI
ncbi:MAG: type IV pilus assembly protein PilM [bacterium]